MNFEDIPPTESFHGYKTHEKKNKKNKISTVVFIRMLSLLANSIGRDIYSFGEIKDTCR